MQNPIWVGRCNQRFRFPSFAVICCNLVRLIHWWRQNLKTICTIFLSCAFEASPPLIITGSTQPQRDRMTKAAWWHCKTRPAFFHVHCDMTCTKQVANVLLLLSFWWKHQHPAKAHRWMLQEKGQYLKSDMLLTGQISQFPKLSSVI